MEHSGREMWVVEWEFCAHSKTRGKMSNLRFCPPGLEMFGLNAGIT